jgi:hypothetical protein
MKDPSAYSSLAAGRPGTPSEGWIYLQFEHGEGKQQYAGCQIARFNLAWLLAGEATGDGLNLAGTESETILLEHVEDRLAFQAADRVDHGPLQQGRCEGRGQIHLPRLAAGFHHLGMADPPLLKRPFELRFLEIDFARGLNQRDQLPPLLVGLASRPLVEPADAQAIARAAERLFAAGAAEHEPDVSQRADEPLGGFASVAPECEGHAARLRLANVQLDCFDMVAHRKPAISAGGSKCGARLAGSSSSPAAELDSNITTAVTTGPRTSNSFRVRRSSTIGHREWTQCRSASIFSNSVSAPSATSFSA